MKGLFQIALRNILRNKKRSFITLSAVAVGLGALIFLRSFIYGTQSQMVENITTVLTNDAQIVPAALENVYNTNGAIEDPESVRRLLRSDPRVLGFAERILGGGMIGSENRSMASFVVGIDPEQEIAIGSRRNAAKGRALTQTDAHAVAIGEKMRKVLEIEIGDRLIVTAQDYYGSLAGEIFTLVGTFETGNDQIDNGTVLITKEAAQRLLSFEHRVSKFALEIDPRFAVADVVRDLRERLRGTDLRVLTWEDLIPMVAGMIRFQNGMIFVVMMIVLSVVAAGILNTLMMSIVERIREFGLIMALGTRPRQVILIVMGEACLLTLTGAALGVLLGVGLTLFFGRVGIDLSRFVSALSNLMIGSQVHPRLDFFSLSLFVAVVIVSNVLVSFIPAWKAGRLVPIEAMRQVG